MKISVVRCRMIGCLYEAAYSDPKVSRRFLSEHQATEHGIGRARGSENFLGCFYDGCNFKVSGSQKFTTDELRAHLIATHNVNAENPVISAEARRSRK